MNGVGEKLKISVAMCTYNGARFLREQLESIAAQTRTPDELVVCDDRSTDETREIVEAFAARAPFAVRLHTNEQNLGTARNFARAIELSRGDIIALSDQDDVWHEEKLRRTEAEFLSGAEVGLVFGDTEVTDENLRPLGYSMLWGNKFTAEDGEKLRAGRSFEVLLNRSIVTGATTALRARFKELVLPIPNDIGLVHDHWIALVVAAVARVSFIEEPLIKYRQHTQQQVGIGVLRDSLNDKLAAARQTTAASYLAAARPLEVLLERLRERAGEEFDAGARAQLEAKIGHLRARAGMPKGRLRRVPVVVKELLAAHYHQYSDGMNSALRDLLL